jgi:predicted O-methyltransferase YrrM
MAPKTKDGRGNAQDNPVREIYRLITAHWTAGALMAATKLDLFSALAEGKATLKEIATRCDTDPTWTEKLLIACTALGVVKKTGDRFQNTPVADEFLVKSSPAYQGNLILHFNNVWERFGELDHTIRTRARGPKELSARQARNEKETAMATQTWVWALHNVAMGGQAAALANALDLRGRKKLCDVGGGSGAYAIALCQRFPDLTAVVLEAPEILPLAQQIIKEAGLAKRITTHPCDFLRDTYGKDYDVLLLSGILHGISEKDRKQVLKKAYQALAQGGLLVIQDMLLNEDKTGPVLPALLSLNMTMGIAYSAAEITAWIEQAGFDQPKIKPIAGYGWMDSLVAATKP